MELVGLTETEMESEEEAELVLLLLSKGLEKATGRDSLDS